VGTASAVAACTLPLRRTDAGPPRRRFSPKGRTRTRTPPRPRTPTTHAKPRTNISRWRTEEQKRLRAGTIRSSGGPDRSRCHRRRRCHHSRSSKGWFTRRVRRNTSCCCSTLPVLRLRSHVARQVQQALRESRAHRRLDRSPSHRRPTLVMATFTNCRVSAGRRARSPYLVSGSSTLKKDPCEPRSPAFRTRMYRITNPCSLPPALLLRTCVRVQLGSVHHDDNRHFLTPVSFLPLFDVVL
jgi:hypothetical protein